MRSNKLYDIGFLRKSIFCKINRLSVLAYVFVPLGFKPRSVALDPAGNLFISDLYRARIRKVYRKSFVNVNSGFESIVSVDKNGTYHVMSSEGRHEKTCDLETGKTLMEFGYDNDQLRFITNSFGNTVEIIWANGKPTEIHSPFGKVTRLDIDDNNNLKKIIYPDDSFFEFNYSNDLLTEITDPENNHYSYAYDLYGRVESTSDDAGGYRTFVNESEADGTKRITVTSGAGNFIEYRDKKDFSGRYTAITTDSAGMESTFTRSPDGFTESLDTPCISNVIYEYDMDPKYRYKTIKSITETTPAGLESLTTKSKIYLDTNGDKLADLITNTILVDGKPSTTVHNVLTSTKTTTSPEGRIVSSTYDPDTLNVLNVETGDLLPTIYDYYDDGRLHYSTIGTRQTEYTYANGNLDTITDPDGSVTVFSEYDALGRVKTILRPDNSIIKYEYDFNGNVTVRTTHTYPADVDHVFGYNAVNQKDLYQAPLSGEYIYQYDTEQRLTKIDFPSGAYIAYNYVNPEDPTDLSLLREIQTPEGNIQYEYYLCGLQTQSVTKGAEVISWDYEGPFTTTETTNGTLNQTLSYIYNNDATDNDFMVDGFTYAGSTETYTYDDDGLLTGAGDFTIARDPVNGLPGLVTDAGSVLNLSRSFNGYGEVDGQDYVINNVDDLYSWEVVERDNSGRIKEKNETVNNVTINYKYDYDPMGRLLTVHKDDVLVEEYDYHNNFQPYGLCSYEMNSLNPGGRVLLYDDEDHLLNAGNISYQYDLDGFLRIKTETAGNTNYNYSSRGELLSVDLPNGNYIEYVHDPLGRRIAKKVNGIIVEKYLWEGQTRLLAVYDGTDALVMRFEYVDGRMPFKMSKSGTDYYLTYDQVGSLRLVTDVAGNIVKRVDYDTFGNVLSDSAPGFKVPFGFAGGLHDRDTGLVRFGHRDYDSEVRRWTAKDPIFFDGGDTDLYGYVLNDPVNFVDPEGLASWHFDRTKEGERLIHYEKYRFNKNGDLVTHRGQKIEDMSKDAKKVLKWLKNVKPNFFENIPLLLLFPGQEQMLNNLQNGFSIDYDSYDACGRPSA